MDDRVYAYLSKYAKFFSSPDLNHVLRRLLNVDREPNPTDTTSIASNVDMLSLIKDGKIQNGDRLYFRCKRGKLTRPYIAVVLDNKLRFGGKLYSMSELTDFIFKSESIHSCEGDAPFSNYWYTDDGISVQELWENLIKSNCRSLKLDNSLGRRSKCLC